MQIPAYQFKPYSVYPHYFPQFGGLDGKRLFPMKLAGAPWSPFQYWHVLQNIALAIEGGMLLREKWVSQCFADNESFDVFLEALEAQDRDARIHDREWFALSVLVSLETENGFVRNCDIADKLRAHAVETGQVDAELGEVDDE